MKTYIQTEDSLHLSVANYLKLQYPNVIFNSDMAGVKLTIFQAQKSAQLRSSKGFPDIAIYEARGGYCGLFIELKRQGTEVFTAKGKPSSKHIEKQLELIVKLRERGYCAEFCCGFEQSKSTIDWYLGLKKT